MRLRNSIYNTIFLLLQQIITAIYGLIVPALIIRTYGSDVNGLVSSITQFLSYISLLESGVGSVITAALYKPLADQDTYKISGIVKAAEDFFRKLSYIFICYLVIVAIVYPYIIRNSFDKGFTFLLIVIISISTFSQYYFGITYQLLLQADQKNWFISLIQIVSTLIILVITIICINVHTSIHVLKLICTIVYVLRPLMLNLYVHKKYNLDKTVIKDKEAINQRWDGLAHHIAYIIHYNTDITVLTFFTNVLEVSVYSVYYNIVSNIYKIISSIKVGIKDSVGNMIARGETELVNKTLDEFETLNFMLLNVFYSCVLILIMPFIRLYTKGVNDINYIRPCFAGILVLSETAYGLRAPYDMIIFAAGHFKQTKKGAYIEAGINILISIILVNHFGIAGVVSGTLVAMCFRAFQYVLYLSKNIVFRPVKVFIKKLVVNLCFGICLCSIFLQIKINISSYSVWIVYAIIVFLTILIFNIIFNMVLFKDNFKGIIKYFFIKRKAVFTNKRRESEK